ncbi:MAG: hypothetical protein ACR2OM_01285, partial [Aestuariivirgaceae bacterium]
MTWKKGGPIPEQPLTVNPGSSTCNRRTDKSPGHLWDRTMKIGRLITLVSRQRTAAGSSAPVLPDTHDKDDRGTEQD